METATSHLLASIRQCPEAITPSPATILTTLDTKCEQSQQDSILCIVSDTQASVRGEGKG